MSSSQLSSSHFLLRDNENILFRQLKRDDSQLLANFSKQLSAGTRELMGLLPVDIAGIEDLCNNLNYDKAIPMVAINSKEEIVGYVVFSFLLRESQVIRFRDYGILLKSGQDACIAPVLADKYQDKGLGSIMLREVIDMAKDLGIHYLILWQGTHVTNFRAIHFYEKFGFVKNGEFDKYGVRNVDMTLDLRAENRAVSKF